MMIANLLLAVHLLSAVIWVGGMAFALLVLRPSLHVLAAPDRLALHVEVFRRFFKIVWHAMPLLVLSGDVMVFYIFGGFRGVDQLVAPANTKAEAQDAVREVVTGGDAGKHALDCGAFGHGLTLRTLRRRSSE